MSKESHLSRSEAIQRITRWGFTAEQYDQAEINFAKNHKTPPLADDVLLDIYNDLLLKYAKADDFSNLHRLNYEIAVFYDELNRDPQSKLEQAAYWQLMEYKKNYADITQVKISSAPDACPACLAHNGKVYAIEQALEEMPIPHKQCTHSLHSIKHSFCRCEYIANDQQQKPAKLSPTVPNVKTGKLVIFLIFLCIACFAFGIILETFSPTDQTPTRVPGVQSTLIPTYTPAPTFTNVPAIDPASARAQKYVDNYGGDFAAYRAIFTLSDCTALQAQFETAYQNNQNAQAGTPNQKQSLGFMTATDERMREIGCYK